MSYSSSLLVTETPRDIPGSERESINGLPPPRQRRFKSARLIGDYEKPWVEDWKKSPDGKKRRLSGRTWDSMIFWGCIFLGFALGAFLCYLAWSKVSNFEYCLVFEDNFENINPDIWSYEIQRGGFGTGSFEWTTNDPLNVFTDEEGLHIVPTLTIDTTDITEAEMLNGYTLNLTTMGVCTADPPTINDCSIYSNQTSGAIINPVRSGRITTQGKKTIKYGRVEVVAKMPVGDWLWPAIWMMPDASVYGAWPASGEIDLAESRGNDGQDYPTGGRDSVISAMHWGPIPSVDAFYKTDGKHNVRRTDYSKAYYTYGLEWSEKYLFTYINSRLLQVFFVNWANGENMWDRGNFGADIVNNSALHDPWSQTGQPNTPFDQEFFLILNVAVGGTNGFWPDAVGNKPWGDASTTAQRDFWNASAIWHPTWGNGTTSGLNVKSAKMWSQGACT